MRCIYVFSASLRSPHFLLSLSQSKMDHPHPTHTHTVFALIFLYSSVITKMCSSKKLPVLFYIHGVLFYIHGGDLQSCLGPYCNIQRQRYLLGKDSSPSAPFLLVMKTLGLHISVWHLIVRALDLNPGSMIFLVWEGSVAEICSEYFTPC